MAHWPEEYSTLHRLGNENLTGLLADLERHGIDACWEPVGELDVANADWQLEDLLGGVAALRRAGDRVTVLDRDAVQAEVASPTFVGGVWRHDNVGLVDPGRLVAGLRQALVGRGVAWPTTRRRTAWNGPTPAWSFGALAWRFVPGG